MSNKRKSRNPDADREVNALLTNISNMGRGDGASYDALLVNFCLENLKRSRGQSKRFIMCKLVEYALASHPDYAEEYGTLRRRYERLSGMTGGDSGVGEAELGLI